MVKVSHVFKEHLFSADTSIDNESPLEVSPKTSQTIYVIALFICFTLTALCQAMNITPDAIPA